MVCILLCTVAVAAPPTFTELNWFDETVTYCLLKLTTPFPNTMSGKKNDTIKINEKEITEEEYSEKEAIKLALENPPEYTPGKSQVFPIVDKLLRTTVLVYPSVQSEEKYKDYSTQANSLFVIGENALGYGLPLLETSSHFFSRKFVTIRKFIIPKGEEPFDIKKHYYDFCVVKRWNGFKCNTLVLEFLNEKVVVFYHLIMPIIDYEYKGVVYRWIDERDIFLKFKFTLLQLGPQRGYSLVDDWDRATDKLATARLLKDVFSISARRKQPALFQDSTPIGELRRTKVLGLHSSELALENNFSSDHNSINSVNDDLLVHLLVGIAVKKQREELEQAAAIALS